MLIAATYLISALVVALLAGLAIITLARYRFKGDAFPHFVWIYIAIFLMDVIATLFILTPNLGFSS